MIHGEKMMRAYSTAGGGVMFVSDEIERTTTSISYNDLVADIPKAKKPSLMLRLFGKDKKDSKDLPKAA